MTEPFVTHVQCACHSHLIELDSWLDGDLFMTIWTPVATKEWGRLHWAWQCLRGRWRGDNEIVLNPEQATELRDALADHVARTTT